MMNETPAIVDGDAIDRMIESHRVLGDSRSIRTDVSYEQVTPAQITEVIEKVKAYCRDNKIAQSRLAKALVLSPSMISQVLSGTYAADVRPVVIALDRWMDRRIQADAMPEVNTFVETGLAQRVRLAAVRAIKAADAGLDTRISLVWGDPGCGKTLAMRAVAEIEGGIMITCGDDICTTNGILLSLACELGITLGRTRAEHFNGVCDALRGTGKLLLIDEVHALLTLRDGAAFHTLRRLADVSGCPQLWGATCNLIEQLQVRERKSEPLGQIVSRIGTQFHLTSQIASTGPGGGASAPLFSVEEVLKIFARNELKLTRDAGEFLARLCTNPKRGLLRTCTALVMHATITHRRDAREITARMLWPLWRSSNRGLCANRF
jgi:DNA transposition AAA+ family ATPase